MDWLESVTRPSGAFAANALGFNTQVPGRRVYLTDTASQRVRVGNQTLTFKRVAPKSFGTDGGPNWAAALVSLRLARWQLHLPASLIAVAFAANSVNSFSSRAKLSGRFSASGLSR